MSMKLDCPLEGCSERIEADTEEEVMSQAADHAQRDHPKMELDQDTVKDLKSQIQPSQ